MNGGKKKFITADIEHGWETFTEAVKKYTVLPFRRLRVEISSSNFSRYDRNLNIRCSRQNRSGNAYW